MFTLCECFEGKHKAATQWADYKLGPSFKQTEVINIEFPPHSTCGFQPASILLRIKHRRGSFPRTLMPFCASVWACIVFAPTCASFVSPLSHVPSRDPAWSLASPIGLRNDGRLDKLWSSDLELCSVGLEKKKMFSGNRNYFFVDKKIIICKQMTLV